MKKIISLILPILLLAVVVFTVSANEYASFVSDGANYLTSSEEAELDNKLHGIYETYGVYPIVLTEDKMSGISAKDSAEDFYYEFFHGKDCIIFYISDYDRKYSFVSFGEKGMDAFRDSDIGDLEEEILPYLKNDNFKKAIFTFADEAENILDVYTNGSLGYKITVIAVAIILPLIIALIAMLVQLSKMKTAVRQNYATNYIKSGSMNLSRSTDLFLYSVITRKARPKPTQTSSGGSNSRSGKF